MTELIITGGVPLQGTVQVSGAKNAALPMMAAAILADAPLELLGVPRLTDVRTMGRLLRQLGVDVARHGDRLLLTPVDTRVVRARLRAGAADAGRILRPGAAAGTAGQGGGAAARRLRHRRPARRSASPRAGRLGRGSAAGSRLHRGHGPAASRRRDRPLRSPRPHGDGHGECPLCRRAGPRTHGHPRRGPRAGNRRPRPDVELAGGADRAVWARRSSKSKAWSGSAAGRYRIIPDRIEAATLMLAAAITGGAVSVVGLVPDHLQTLLARLEASGISHRCAGRSRGGAGRCPAASRERGRRTVSGPADRSSSTLDGIHGDGGRPEFRGGPRVSHALGTRGRTQATGRRFAMRARRRADRRELPLSRRRRWRPPICGPAPP